MSAAHALPIERVDPFDVEGGCVWQLCADCGVKQLFAAPPCEDGHGLDCPDLACTVCGLAMTRTALLLTDDVLRTSTR